MGPWLRSTLGFLFAAWRAVPRGLFRFMKHFAKKSRAKGEWFLGLWLSRCTVSHRTIGRESYGNYPLTVGIESICDRAAFSLVFRCISQVNEVISKNGRARCFHIERVLTKAPDKRRQWLRVRLHVPLRDANQTRSRLSVARSWKESKSQQWTMTAQSGLCSKTEPISHSMLNRSFVSRPIFPTGKLTTTDASNAGHRCTANNSLTT
jgi:hypothetical protein